MEVLRVEKRYSSAVHLPSTEIITLPMAIIKSTLAGSQPSFKSRSKITHQIFVLKVSFQGFR